MPDVAETAAAWRLETLNGLSPRRRRDMDAWLAEDAEHGAAYDAAGRVLETTERHAADPEMLRLREAALRARPYRPAPSRSWFIASVLVGLSALIGGGWLVAREPTSTLAVAGGDAAPTSRYATAVGERSTVALPDGSRMHLNTASAARLAYTPSERVVHLESGQALFEVAKDATAPFRVYAGDREITATGTMFDVRRDGARLQVALLEGEVRIREWIGAPQTAGAPSSETRTLKAGEVYRLSGPGQPARVADGEVDHVASWRTGLLVFDEQPLADAVEEINRYTNRPITIGDAQAGRHRLSGTFRTGDAERFALTVTELLPVTMESSGDGQIVLVSRDP